MGEGKGRRGGGRERERGEPEGGSGRRKGKERKGERGREGREGREGRREHIALPQILPLLTLRKEKLWKTSIAVSSFRGLGTSGTMYEPHNVWHMFHRPDSILLVPSCLKRPAIVQTAGE